MDLYKNSKTFVATPSSAERKWLVIDAGDYVLGFLASKIAMILRGKHKRYYTPNIDCGDSVVVLNAEKVKITGKKLDGKRFYWHTGYPGGIKERTWRQILEGEHPERLIIKAVERMMPKDSPLARKQMKSLYVYKGENNLHVAQNPEILKI